jgi:hypothetical protein
MELERELIVHLDASLLAANGCSRKSLGLMVLSRGTRQGLWPKVILKKRVKTSLILIH